MLYYAPNSTDFFSVRFMTWSFSHVLKQQRSWGMIWPGNAHWISLHRSKNSTEGDAQVLTAWFPNHQELPLVLVLIYCSVCSVCRDICCLIIWTSEAVSCGFGWKKQNRKSKITNKSAYPCMKLSVQFRNKILLTIRCLSQCPAQFLTVHLM